MSAEKITRLTCIAAAAGSALSACTASPPIQQSVAPSAAFVDADEAPVMTDMYSESPDPQDMEVYNFQVQTILERYPDLSVIGSITQRGSAGHQIQRTENDHAELAIAITCSGDGQWQMSSPAGASVSSGSCGRRQVAVVEPQAGPEDGTQLQLWQLSLDDDQRAWLLFFTY